ncbi:MAG TPA: DUF4268 domain-containing protein [Citreicella sp.]|jgi:hypothetical protein|nr:DUF4268 domain-containing protein [Citreicella sp.]
MRLGKLETVDIRAVWRNETAEFTPWLAQEDNLIALGEALHLGELTLQATEHSVGDFSADIVAVDEGGVQVLIENQLEPTDHRHLGQVLTYLAGLGSNEATIVWVSTRFREEHRAAIDWLNRSTLDGYDFFGVEIEILRIGGSDPAPRFNLVAMPNDWARQARQAARRAASDPVGPAGEFYQRYWTAMREVYEATDDKRRYPKAWPRQWLAFRIGRSGFHISAVANHTANSLRVELYMHQKGLPFNQAYNALFSQRDEIEAAYGSPLDWQALPESTAARIAVHLPDADVSNRADWSRQHAWILSQVAHFRSLFSERVKHLSLNASGG